MASGNNYNVASPHPSIILIPYLKTTLSVKDKTSRKPQQSIQKAYLVTCFNDNTAIKYFAIKLTFGQRQP